MANTAFGTSHSQGRTSPLPTGWEMLIDKTTGWPFFVDHNSQTTSWQDPRGPVKGQYPQQPQYGFSAGFSQPTSNMREIPIQRATGFSSPHRGSPAREIPIIREGAGTGTPPRAGTPSRQTYSPHQQPYPGQQGSHAYPGQHGPPQQYPGQQPPQQPYPGQPAPNQQPFAYSGSSMPSQPSYPNGTAWSTMPQPPRTEPSPWQQPAPQAPDPAPQQKGGFWTIPIQRDPPGSRISPPKSAATPGSTGPGVPQPPSAPTTYEAPPTVTTAPSGAQQTLAPDPPAPQRRSPSPNPQTPLEKVESIFAACEDLEQQVNGFTGTRGDKDYLYLEEMLTRLLLKLDNIDSEGKEEIRNIRRKAVRTVQGSADQLELKALANATPGPNSSNSVQSDSNRPH